MGLGVGLGVGLGLGVPSSTSSSTSTSKKGAGVGASVAGSSGSSSNSAEHAYPVNEEGLLAHTRSAQLHESSRRPAHAVPATTVQGVVVVVVVVVIAVVAPLVVDVVVVVVGVLSFIMNKRERSSVDNRENDKYIAFYHEYSHQGGVHQIPNHLCHCNIQTCKDYFQCSGIRSGTEHAQLE